MSSFLIAFIVTFGVVLLVELPDKTLVASLVLSTRYRPRPVLVGVAAAFAIQCTIAVVAGGLLRLVAREGEPLAVGLGAWVALVGVAALAVVAGKLIIKRVPVHMVQRVAGGLFAIFAVVAAVTAIR
jgi:putative Ca2+/H+ antiporter (TMEM165/GDT1 family)